MWNMQTRLLGRTGESLSVVGLGAIVFLEEDEKFARETKESLPFSRFNLR